MYFWQIRWRPAGLELSASTNTEVAGVGGWTDHVKNRAYVIFSSKSVLKLM